MRMNEDNRKGAVLWRQFKNGDQNAFKDIYSQYYPQLFGYGLRWLNDSDELEDSIQELFLKLWRNRTRLADVKAPRAYLFKALRGVLMDAARKNKPKERLSENTEFNDLNLSVEDMVIRDEIHKEQKEGLQRSLALLTNRQKEVIYLKFYNGLSYQEIGEILEINYQSIRNCVYDAIKVLKKDLLYVTLTLAYTIFCIG